MPVDHFCWGGWWLFPIIMPIVMVVVLITVLSLVFGRGGCRPPWWGAHGKQPGSETAMDILKRRYAKGEITKDEFERMKSDIQ